MVHTFGRAVAKTLLAVFQQSLDLIRFPDSDTAPRHPAGRYHLARFIGSSSLLDVFGEQFPLPPEAVYEYVIATIDVGRQKLLVNIENLPVAEYDYRLR